ncbi:carboxymuconolactone decarboxylase family protein [Pedobacter duraquae]|uniref:Alkylhydroperoxidase/carboxymuconolactone decarboxylase family protein YurZ n=1 Tax=Pedobacter duraquae TaxID=425511 RepID=A0A4R6IKB5_9SPHI|nr:carboxymuconolactone decarboxylase family protein [Pedobacter duraquae]TDO22487.1 alkylhydroperoxidase/carboxymuconolactone decarboxylase family protein YurZ [Pedobacter duraquae]
MKKQSRCMVLVLLSIIAGVNPVSAEDIKSVDDQLNKRQRAIVAISALTAKGNQQALAPEIGKGLDAGLTINEVKEILVQLAAYAGFPRSLNAINSLKKTMDERIAKGINDPVGPQPLALDSTANRYELGKANLEKLSGKAEGNTKAGYAVVVPVIEVFLKEHLFADIFSRGVLSYQDRELVTVSALTSLGGVESQLQGHLGLSMYNGLTVPQLTQMLDIVANLVGKKEAEDGQLVLKKVADAQKKK